MAIQWTLSRPRTQAQSRGIPAGMKLVTFEEGGRVRPGALDNDDVVDLSSIADSVLSIVERQDELLPKCRAATGPRVPLAKVKLLSPIPRPPSMRDGYAFRQHVLTARKNRGLEM